MARLLTVYQENHEFISGNRGIWLVLSTDFF